MTKAQSQTSQTCAYCGMLTPPTKEHLFPACLIAKDTEPTSQFLEVAGKASIKRDATIRDVCAECNNRRLSPLDSYICNLYDAFFQEELIQDESVQFAYDYDSLARWLLKVSYNVARTRNDTDARILAKFAPYILNIETPSQFAIFVQVAAPYLLSPEEEAILRPTTRESLPMLKGRRYFPNCFSYRASRMEKGIDGVLSRLVSINAYYFYVVAPHNKLPPKDWQKIRRAIRGTFGEPRQLITGSHSVVLFPKPLNLIKLIAPTFRRNPDAFKKAYEGTKNSK